MKFLKTLFILISTSVIFTGCIDLEQNYVEDYDSVYTDYFSDFDFSQSYTYSLPLKVVKKDGNTNENDPIEYIDQDYADTILDAIRRNLDGKGWTEIDRNLEAQAPIMVSAFDQTHLYAYYDWYYWYWGWGWYYPYPPTYISGYKSGSVAIEMFDTATTNEDGDHPVVWLGTFNGIISGNKSTITPRINKNVDQAFKHNPFKN